MNNLKDFFVSNWTVSMVAPKNEEISGLN